MAEGSAHQIPASGSSTTLDEPLAVLSEGASADPQFLHTVLCQPGLPRNPTLSRTFERTSGRASLSLQAGRTFDGMNWIDQPLPSGTRPRLVLINLCWESVRTRSPDVDIGGSVREFLRRLNIDAGGESMAQFRKQMLGLELLPHDARHDDGERACPGRCEANRRVPVLAYERGCMPA